jgi:hypothetical protein
VIDRGSQQKSIYFLITFFFLACVAPAGSASVVIDDDMLTLEQGITAASTAAISIPISGKNFFLFNYEPRSA